MKPTFEDQMIALFGLVVFFALILYRPRWRPSGKAFGTATWMSDKALWAAGMLANDGLILGRTFGGELIRLPQYCSVLICGGIGSGKGVSLVLPNLIKYNRGSVVCFDTKGDLYETTAARRAAMGQRIIRLAPFNGGEDAMNPLDTVERDSPMLVDSARAMAEALVARLGTEPDQYWNDKSVQVISAVLVLVLLVFKDEDRNLSSMLEIISDIDLLKAAIVKLQELGGVPARLGNQLKTLFHGDGSEYTKEGASVISSVIRHTAFLNSELVARAVSTSTFNPADLRKPGITLFIQIPPALLEAQRGLLRCWFSTLIRIIGEVGNENEGEVLVLIDEASALGSSLPALEEALVRGRSAGVRLVLAYQSSSQITTAFKDKPTLLYDNCSTQIFLGAASSYEGAERLSKSIGERTQVIENFGENESRSSQDGGSQQGGGQRSRGSSLNYSENGRALLRPEEILTLNNDYVIVLLRGSPPILAKRVKWYEDPDFNPSIPRRARQATPLWLLLAIALGLVVLAMASM